MNLLAPVKNVMNANLIKVDYTDSLKKVGDVFNSNKIHHLLVVNNEKLVGIISKGDYLFFRRGFIENDVNKKMEKLRLKAYTAADIMTEKIVTLQVDEKLNVALEIFKENLFRAIPILENEELVGLVTTYDIIKYLAADKSAINEYIL